MTPLLLAGSLESILKLVGLVVLAYALVLWLSAIVWVYRDVRGRTNDEASQWIAVVLVGLFNLPGLILYLILRPRETLLEVYERRLETEALMSEMPERRACQRLPPSFTRASAADSPVTLEAALKLVNAEAAKTLPPDRLRRQVRWLLEAEVFRILLEKEGLARGYGDRPEVVRALDKVTDEAALEYLLGKVVLAKVEIGAGDAEAYYRSHAKEFTEPEALKLSAILVETEDPGGPFGAKSVGEAQYGYYLQAAYDLMSLRPSGQWSVTPFVRYEKLDTQDGVPAGFQKDPASTRTLVTAGLGVRPLPQVVLKADYQRMRNQARTGVSQFNLAVGYLF